jgi:predicted esterase
VNAYNANKLGLTAIKVPVFEYHELNDDAVDYNQGHTLMQTYCKAGVNVTWKTYPTDHITGIHDGNADSLAWMQGVLAGTAPTPNCAGA